MPVLKWLIYAWISGINISISTSATNNAVKRGTVVTFTAVSDGYLDDVYFLWYISDNTSYAGYGSDETVISHNFTKYAFLNSYAAMINFHKIT
jgi:hypothetical protein